MIPQTIDELRTNVLAMLEDDDEAPDNDENLVDYGLDSIQIMNLAAEWQQQLPQISFMSMAQTPSIDAWWTLIEKEATA